VIELPSGTALIRNGKYLRSTNFSICVYYQPESPSDFDHCIRMWSLWSNVQLLSSGYRLAVHRWYTTTNTSLHSNMYLNHSSRLCSHFRPCMISFNIKLASRLQIYYTFILILVLLQWFVIFVKWIITTTHQCTIEIVYAKRREPLWGKLAVKLQHHSPKLNPQSLPKRQSQTTHILIIPKLNFIKSPNYII